MRKLVLFLGILLLFTACETGTKYDTNTSNKENNLVDDIEVDDIAVDELYDDPTHSESYFIDQGEDNYIEEIASANRELSDVIPRDISQEEFIKESQIEQEESNVQHFEGGTVADGLDIKSIRKANHDSYIRLVFDSDGINSKAPKIGSYKVDSDPSKKLVTVVFNGYEKFSAKFPTFENFSIVEKIGFAKYLDGSGYKIDINLRESTKIKVMALESPARLVIDVQKP